MRYTSHCSLFLHASLYFHFAVVASLTACGGGGGSSSPAPAPVTDPAPVETSYCDAVENTITLAEGASCTLTPAQLDLISRSAGTDEASCSSGRASFGGIQAQPLRLNGLTIKCEEQEEQPVDRTAFRVTNSTEFAQVNAASDEFVNFKSLTVEGNAEAITEDGVSYAQVQGNQENGEFSVIIDTADIVSISEGSDARILVAFTSSDISAENAIKGEPSVSPQLTIRNLHSFAPTFTMNCQYGGSVESISCETIGVTLANPPSELPARLNVHMLGCNTDNICKNGISVPIQFN